MRNRDCRLCELCHGAKQVCLWGTGNEKAKVMLVNGTTTYTDAFQNYPLAGEAGDLLDHILFKMGVSRADLYVTNLIKCNAKKDAMPKGKALLPITTACGYYFQQELARINPKVIVVMGSVAVKHICGINFVTRAEGYPIEHDGRIYIPCYSVAAALQAPSTEKNIVMTLAKAFELAGVEVKAEGKGLIYNYKDVGGIEI